MKKNEGVWLHSEMYCLSNILFLVNQTTTVQLQIQQSISANQNKHLNNAAAESISVWKKLAVVQWLFSGDPLLWLIVHLCIITYLLANSWESTLVWSLDNIAYSKEKKKKSTTKLLKMKYAFILCFRYKTRGLICCCIIQNW